MLPKTVTQLLKEIAARYGEKKERQVEDDPEACLISLLTTIKEELPHGWVMLQSAVEQGMYQSKVDEARKELKSERAKK